MVARTAHDRLCPRELLRKAMAGMATPPVRGDKPRTKAVAALAQELEAAAVMVACSIGLFCKPSHPDTLKITQNHELLRCTRVSKLQKRDAMDWRAAVRRENSNQSNHALRCTGEIEGMQESDEQQEIEHVNTLALPFQNPSQPKT